MSIIPLKNIAHEGFITDKKLGYTNEDFCRN